MMQCQERCSRVHGSAASSREKGLCSWRRGLAGLQEVETGCAGTGPFSIVMAFWDPERDVLKDVKGLGLKELGDFIKHVRSTRPIRLDNVVKPNSDKVSQIFPKPPFDYFFLIQTPLIAILTLLIKEVGGEVSDIFLSSVLLFLTSLWFIILKQSALNIPCYQKLTYQLIEFDIIRVMEKYLKAIGCKQEHKSKDMGGGRGGRGG